MPAAIPAVPAIPLGQALGAVSCEKVVPALVAERTDTQGSCDLERADSADSAEALSPPANVAQPGSPPQASLHEESSQSSPVDDDRDMIDAEPTSTEAEADMAVAPLPLERASAPGSFADVRQAAEVPAPPLPPAAAFARVNVKGQGLGEDDVARANEEVRAAIVALSSLLDSQPQLEVRVAETETELLDALKLYRDMNHLSLTGVTCEQVVEHVLSHTINLYYKPEPNAPAIAVTAATFTMRQSTMMLRLLATHPRMTRKGFGRVTVHFLKELCRALHKNDILVYTYPSSSSFYKALNFRHTHAGETAKPSVAEAGADAAARESAREARRAFSAKENEMIFMVQPTMAQVLSKACRAAASTTAAHPYACTRRRASTAEDGAPAPAAVCQPTSAPPPAPAVTAPEVPAPAAASRSRRAGGGKKGGAASAKTTAPDEASQGKSAGKRSSARADAGSSSSKANDEQAAQATSWVSAVAPLFTPSSRSPSAPGDPGAEAPASSSAAASAAAQAAKAILASVAAESGCGSSSSSANADSETTASPRKRPRIKSKDVYQVEKIVGVQRSATDPADIKYLIKWKGWAAKFNTWEPVDHLSNLQAEIAAFEATQV